MSDGTHVANVSNDSQVTGGGLLVSGTNQCAGRIQGAGNVVVAAGASLTANSIVQNALNIAGSSGSHGLVTIAPSDASGNPLVELDSAASGVLSTFGTNDALVGALPEIGGGSSSESSGLPFAPSAVPEPGALLLLGLGLASLSVAASSLRKPPHRPRRNQSAEN